MNENDLKFRTASGPPVQLAPDELLIEELMKRNRLKVVMATQEVDLLQKDRPGLWHGVEKRIAEMIGDFMLRNQMIAHDTETARQRNMLTFSGSVVALTTLEEERPL